MKTIADMDSIGKMFNYLAVHQCTALGCREQIGDDDDAIIVHKQGLEFRFCPKHVEEAVETLKWYGEMVRPWEYKNE